MDKSNYKTLTRNLKYIIIQLYLVSSFYLIGFFLFIFSVEIIVIKSIKTSGFEWNNLNLIWIFGLIILLITFIWNMLVYYQTLKIQNIIIQFYFNEIQILNKYLKKWKQKVIEHKNTKWWFLNIFNIEVWLRSIMKNLDYIYEHQTKNHNTKKDKMQTIVEKYYEQLNKKNNNKV